EPRVAPAAQNRARSRPARHVRLVLVGHADGRPVERGFAVPGEVEHVLVTVVDEAWAVDGLVVAHREVAVQRRATGGVAIEGDRRDPVYRVLEREDPPGHAGHIQAGPGIG